MRPAELANFVIKQVGFALADEIENKGPIDPLLLREVEALGQLCSNASERGYDLACIVRITFAAQSRYPGQVIHHFEPQPDFCQRISVNGELLGD